ncbi:MAG: hypothetical protein AMXMBFR64_40980 [Myxococcales bacterium]
MITGINVTPMVDVVLVLLVIMMVSAQYIVSQTIKVELPEAKTSDGSTSSPIAVTITKDGKLHFNKEEVTPAQLAGKLSEAWRADKDVNLVVGADRTTHHGAVMAVIDAARLAGIQRFAINVDKVE